MLSAISRRSGNALGFLACAGLMGYALYAQYVLGCSRARCASFSDRHHRDGHPVLIAAIITARHRLRSVRRTDTLAALGGMLSQPPSLCDPGAAAWHGRGCGADLNYLIEIMP
jgi:hypothetical protein